MPYAFSSDTFGLEAGRFRIAIQRLLVLVDGSDIYIAWLCFWRVLDSFKESLFSWVQYSSELYAWWGVISRSLVLLLILKNSWLEHHLENKPEWYCQTLNVSISHEISSPHTPAVNLIDIALHLLQSLQPPSLLAVSVPMFKYGITK